MYPNSDKFCEQGGALTGNTERKFIKPYKDNNITIATQLKNAETSVNMFNKISYLYADRFLCLTGYASIAYAYPCWFTASGYIS